jgi:hypothetical protein
MTIDPALVAQFSDRKWRLNNLYWIVDKRGNVSKFRLNKAQDKLLDELHYLNIILKARQLGFSTLILVMALDACLFNSNYSAGLIADTLDNAKALLDRIKFAYERLPDVLKAKILVTTDNKENIEFGNGSSVRVGTSLRSGTYNFLHISEYGKICAKFPDKANEIKSGALNTVAPRQLVFIESTAEGKAGDFYDKALAAEKLYDANRQPGEMEYKFHFFPWMDDPAYTSDVATQHTDEDNAYWVELQNKGIKLTTGQKNWYSAKRKEQGADMWKEFPSTPDEAFKAIRDGAYFAKDIQNLRIRKAIGKLPYFAGCEVHTAWDFGLNDATSIWLFQVVAGKHRFIGYHEASGEGLGYFFDWLSRYRSIHGATWGRHFAPHDVDVQRHGQDGRVTSIKEIARGLGWSFETVKRTTDKLNSIQAVRAKLPQCEFDEGGQGIEQGLSHLENYTRDWDDNLGVWKSKPRHDEHSHAADAFMTFADGFEEKPAFVDPWTKHKVRSVA